MSTNVTLDFSNPIIIEDAVRLSKSQFIELYEQLGGNKVRLGVNWHIIRTAPKNEGLMKKYHPSGMNATAPSTIGIMEEEVADRKKRLQLHSVQQPILSDEPDHVIEDGEDDPNNEGSKAFNEVNQAVLKEELKSEQKVKVAKAPKVVKEKKVKSPAVNKTKPAKAKGEMERGDKTSKAKALIEKGQTNAREISQSSGAAVGYVRVLLTAYRKTQK